MAFLAAFVDEVGAQTLVDTTPAVGCGSVSARHAREQSSARVPDSPFFDRDILPDDLVSDLRPVSAPDDPCLPRLYKDWSEVSHHVRESFRDAQRRLRIVIDRSSFVLTLELLGPYGDAQEVYRTQVGLGGVDSPTPQGVFIINHLYPYPDVKYFTSSGEPIPALYNGFFAPLLVCDKAGRCERYRDMGIHGFRGSAHPDPSVRRTGTRGPVSSGCIRLPDPCEFKKVFLQFVELGPVKRNDRGSYHWLKTPVEVRIDADYPAPEEDLTLASIFEESLKEVRSGIGNLWEGLWEGPR